MRFVFEPLEPHHDRAAFDCGQERQTLYFRQTALQHHQKNIAAVKVLWDAEEKRVAGYYTLSMLAIDAGVLPPDLSKSLKLPKQGPLPAVLIGRLARDLRYRGEGAGEILVIDALRTAYIASRDVGCIAVVVDPDGAEAKEFWSAFGFIELPQANGRAFLPMTTVGTLLRKAGFPES